jgi:hypothetical protein
MKITNFLATKDTPLESVEADKETAGRLVVEAVGWEIDGNIFYTSITENTDDISNIPQRFSWISRTLNLTDKLEKAAISKTSEIGYYAHLERIVKKVVESERVNLLYPKPVSMLAVRARTVRATAIQRLTAILITLAEVEKCKQYAITIAKQHRIARFCTTQIAETFRIV